MSKKLKAAGKKGSGTSAKKSAAAPKKKPAPAHKTSAKKTATKGKATKSRPVAKAVKKLAAKALKAVAGNGKKSSATKPAKKGIVKKFVKTVKKALTSNTKSNDKKKGSTDKHNKKTTSKTSPISVTAAKTGKIAPKETKPVRAAVPAPSRHAIIGKNGTEAKKPEKNSTDNRKLNDLFTKKQSDRKPDDVLAITNTIPVKAKAEISPSKIASISHSITNPVRKTDSYSVKAEKEPAGKFEMEFVVHASAEMLYEFLSTASGLSEWFCDDLNIRNGIYTFIWDDQLQQARLLKTIDQQLVRFQWVDKTDGSYFEFRIQRDDLTNDISLIITDFADTSSERESSKLLWNSQVEKLMHVLGSIF